MGNILRKVGEEKYRFRDDTGEVTVEIDDDEGAGFKITPEMTVRIYGEVDRQLLGAEIDVERIELIATAGKPESGSPGK